MSYNVPAVAEPAKPSGSQAQLFPRLKSGSHAPFATKPVGSEAAHAAEAGNSYVMGSRQQSDWSNPGFRTLRAGLGAFAPPPDCQWGGLLQTSIVTHDATDEAQLVVKHPFPRLATVKGQANHRRPLQGSKRSLPHPQSTFDLPSLPQLQFLHWRLSRGGPLSSQATRLDPHSR